MMNNSTKCTVCGYDYGLHRGHTDQCPIGGEAPVGRPQLWAETTFEEEQPDQSARIAELEAEVKRLKEEKSTLLEALEEMTAGGGNVCGFDNPCACRFCRSRAIIAKFKADQA